MKNISLYGVVNTPEMEAAAIKVLRSGRIANGEHVTEFEAGIGKIVGSQNVVSTVDMTSAMFLALHLAGVGNGDEVLTTAFACLSTNSAIAQCGAVPIWVDVKPKTVEIDLSDLLGKITSNTKAVILYHVAGYPGPAKEVAALCRQRGIALIEDCDNALFAYRDGVHVGGEGDFAVYSFYPTRQINTTEGGALVCKSAEHAANARRLRRFGIDPLTFRNHDGEINPSSEIAEVGWAFTMNNLCAALGCAQLSTSAARVDRARENAATLIQMIRDLGPVQLIPASGGTRPAFWVLLILVSDRDTVLRSMKSQGVQVSCIHQRNDVYSGFRQRSLNALPNTTYLQDHILGLPCGWWLSQDDLYMIAGALQQAVTLAPLS